VASRARVNGILKDAAPPGSRPRTRQSVQATRSDAESEEIAVRSPAQVDPHRAWRAAADAAGGGVAGPVCRPTAHPADAHHQIGGALSRASSRPLLYRWVDLPRVPETFLKHVWISEDQRFFQHDGFDWKEIDIAMERAERRGTPVRGASTITMQCARSIFLWQGRSWIRKGIEAYYTFWMETLLSKRPHHGAVRQRDRTRPRHLRH
jgi:hypothetical protein